jgi:phosphoribosylformylglycinamidine cyclo-ligase
MKIKRLTYKKAGVDVAKADRFIEKIKPIIQLASSRQSLAPLGTFGGLFKFASRKYKSPILVASADGVGTKLKLAALLNKHDTVGIDLVAMNVNDILCCGARPLFFLDYISCGKLKSPLLVQVIKGIVKGCRLAGCVLLGGETAEMPGMYKDGDYDLAGFCVGVVEQGRLLGSQRVSQGDKLIGLASNGLHSNGFSLVRKVFNQKEIKRHAKELLKPTRVYVKPLLSLLRNNVIKAIAHITGGAFYGKLPRVIPPGSSFRIKKGSWPVPKIFGLIQSKGGIEDKEMFSTFNMGIGMILAVKKNAADKVIKDLARYNLRAWVIGEAIRGAREVDIV